MTVLAVSACSDGYAQSQASGPGPAPVGGGRAENVKLATGDARQSGGVIAAGGADAVYNYGPTVMLDRGQVRMWWCSQYGSAPPG